MRLRVQEAAKRSSANRKSQVVLRKSGKVRCELCRELGSGCIPADRLVFQGFQ